MLRTLLTLALKLAVATVMAGVIWVTIIIPALIGWSVLLHVLGVL